MILSYVLSMPNIGSWNGKWTGEDNFYAIVKNMGKSKKAEIKEKEILKEGYFHYNFGDGWSMGITVKEVDSKEAAKIRRKSKGFYGYDWAVTSIENHLEIQTGA